MNCLWSRDSFGCCLRDVGWQRLLWLGPESDLRDIARGRAVKLELQRGGCMPWAVASCIVLLWKGALKLAVGWGAHWAMAFCICLLWEGALLLAFPSEPFPCTKCYHFAWPSCRIDLSDRQGRSRNLSSPALIFIASKYQISKQIRPMSTYARQAESTIHLRAPSMLRGKWSMWATWLACGLFSWLVKGSACKAQHIVSCRICHCWNIMPCKPVLQVQKYHLEEEEEDALNSLSRL